MKNMLRWALVLPVALAASGISWAILAFVWRLTDAVNIVSQSDTISIALVNFGINSISSGLGILAGAEAAPNVRPKAAVVLGAVYVGTAVATLVFGAGMRDTLHMSLGWHLWSTAACVLGSVIGTLAARNLPGRSVQPSK